MDGMLRRRGGALERLLHDGPTPVRVRVWPTTSGRCGWRRAPEPRPPSTGSPACASRWASTDYGRSCARSRGPLIGRHSATSLAAGPAPGALRGARLGDLRAADRVRAGRRDPAPPARPAGASLVPATVTAACATAAAAVLAGTSPALLQSLDLGAGRRGRSSGAAARSRADGSTSAPRDHKTSAGGGCARFRGVGSVDGRDAGAHGQGRHDQVPAGDLGLRKLAGRLQSGGDPRAVAEEQQVRELFAPYGPWAGLAAAHVM